jgi:hypothetical protein
MNLVKNYKFAQKHLTSCPHYFHGGTTESYETSVAGFQVDVSPQELPHTKKETHSLNRDVK